MGLLGEDGCSSYRGRLLGGENPAQPRRLSLLTLQGPCPSPQQPLSCPVGPALLPSVLVPLPRPQHPQGLGGIPPPPGSVCQPGAKQRMEPHQSFQESGLSTNKRSTPPPLAWLLSAKQKTGVDEPVEKSEPSCVTGGDIT